MALPIGATPVLEGEEATKLIALIHKESKMPARLTPTPKLAKAHELIKEYARDEQKLVR